MGFPFSTPCLTAIDLVFLQALHPSFSTAGLCSPLSIPTSFLLLSAHLPAGRTDRTERGTFLLTLLYTSLSQCLFPSSWLSRSCGEIVLCLHCLWAWACSDGRVCTPGLCTESPLMHRSWTTVKAFADKGDSIKLLWFFRGLQHDQNVPQDDKRAFTMQRMPFQISILPSASQRGARASQKKSQKILLWAIQLIFLGLHLNMIGLLWLKSSERRFTRFQLERSNTNQDYKEMRPECPTRRWWPPSGVPWAAALPPRSNQHSQKLCSCPRPPRGAQVWHPTPALVLQQSRCLLQNLKVVKRHPLMTALPSSSPVLDLHHRPFQAPCTWHRELIQQ